MLNIEQAVIIDSRARELRHRAAGLLEDSSRRDVERPKEVPGIVLRVEDAAVRDRDEGAVDAAGPPPYSRAGQVQAPAA